MGIRIALVDQRELFREGFCALLAGQPDLEVVGQVSDARGAYELAAAVDPDVVIMEVVLPDVSGITATRELMRRHHRCRVLMLSNSAERQCVSEALAAGARGYALKLQPSTQVFEAIRAVQQNHTYLAPMISGLIVEQHLRVHRGEEPNPGPCDALSPREREVLELLLRGLNNKTVGQRLFISIKTVESHRAHILKKLGLHSTVELMRFAARNHLLWD